MNPLMTSSCEKYNEILEKKKKKRTWQLWKQMCVEELWWVQLEGNIQPDMQEDPNRTQTSAACSACFCTHMQSKARNTVIQPFSLNIISLGLFSLLYDVMEQEIRKAHARVAPWSTWRSTCWAILMSNTPLRETRELGHILRRKYGKMNEGLSQFQAKIKQFEFSVTESNTTFLLVSHN